MGNFSPILDDISISFVTTANGAVGGDTFIVSTAGFTDNFFRLWTAQIIASTTTAIATEKRKVVSYNSLSGLFVVSPPFTAMVPISAHVKLINDLPVGDSASSPPISLTGIATGVGLANTLIDTINLTDADDYWNGQLLYMITGANAGLGRPIVDFTSATSELIVDPSFPNVSAIGDVYAILGLPYNAAFVNDTGIVNWYQVIGNKGDAAVTVPNGTASVIAYLKGILTLPALTTVRANVSVGPSNFFAAPVGIISLSPTGDTMISGLYVDVSGFTNGAVLTGTVIVKVGATNTERQWQVQFSKDANNTLWPVIQSEVMIPGVATGLVINLSSDNAGDIAVTVPLSYYSRRVN